MKIIKIGIALPEQRESIRDLLPINPTWDETAILAKTGIRSRRTASDAESAVTLAKAAAVKALENCDPMLIGGLILVTQSTEVPIPTVACGLHRELGLAAEAFAFDVNQGCAGFVYGLAIACGMFNFIQLPRVLLVCSDTYTKFISKTDRTCRPIFSDGATATLIEQSAGGGMLASIFMTDGNGGPNLCLTTSGLPGNDKKSVLKMEGSKVFVFTMAAVPDATRRLLRQANMTIDDVDLFFFHQASKMVLDQIQALLQIPNEKMVRNFEEIGNTVSSTIPMALATKIACGELRPGMNILCVGFGVGYSLAGCIWRVA